MNFARLKDILAMDDRWITVHPNGQEKKGRPALIDESGTVKGGMGGRFNGQKISEAHSSFRGPRVDRSKIKAVAEKQEKTASRQGSSSTVVGRVDAIKSGKEMLERRKEIMGELEKYATGEDFPQDRLEGLLLEIGLIEQKLGRGSNHLAKITPEEAKAVLDRCGAAVKDFKTHREEVVYRKTHMSPEVIAGERRGKPMNYALADSTNVNPDYAVSADHRQNCQSCTLAFELRMRGYNVEARPWGPRELGGSAEDGPRLSSHYTSCFIDPISGEPTKPIKLECDNTRDEGQAKKFVKKLDGMIKSGERYMFFCEWKGKKSSHVFNIMKTDDGEIRVIDAQLGVSLGRNHAHEYFTMMGQMEDMKIFRTDNMQITTEYEGVLKKGGDLEEAKKRQFKANQSFMEMVRPTLEKMKAGRKS